MTGLSDIPNTKYYFFIRGLRKGRNSLNSSRTSSSKVFYFYFYFSNSSSSYLKPFPSFFGELRNFETYHVCFFYSSYFCRLSFLLNAVTVRRLLLCFSLSSMRGICLPIGLSSQIARFVLLISF